MNTKQERIKLIFTLPIYFSGKIIIFKVGLLLLYRCFNSSTFRKQCDGVDEILMQAQTIPAQLDNPEELVHDVSATILLT